MLLVEDGVVAVGDGDETRNGTEGVTLERQKGRGKRGRDHND